MTNKELKLRYDLAMKKISYLVSPAMYEKFENDVDEFVKGGKKRIDVFFKNEF